jgi:hypothetical protein
VHREQGDSSPLLSLIRMVLTLSYSKSRFLRNCFEHMFLQITRAIATEFGPYKIPKDLNPGAIREIQLTPQLENLYLKLIASKRPKKRADKGGVKEKNHVTRNEENVTSSRVS